MRAVDEAGLRVRQVLHGVSRRLAPPPSVRVGIAALAEHASGLDADDRPVFVLGAGWRTGSTWLQRMLNATPGTLVWGEPWSDGAIVERLGESLAFLDPRRGRFPGRTLAPEDPLPGVTEWTANLTPPLADLVHAQRAMLDRMWKWPAAAHGCPRWGAKEVVRGRETVDLLALLYPGARFLLLVRDPVTQWRSYRPSSRRAWYLRYPERPVAGPFAFGRMWDRLVRDFAAADQELDRATIVRYEDLSSPAERSRLTAFLEWDTELSGDLPRVGSSREARFFRDTVPEWERAVVRRTTSGSRGLVGYE